jgi:phosphotransferase system enzyme I (PtsI)
VIRTLDLGGDKLSYLVPSPREMNPFLGWRAIRLTLANSTLFKSQLRAILRASVTGNVSIMYPMISRVEELLEAKAMLEETRAELRSEGTPFDEDCPVGAMVEVPAAAMVADQLADEVDFFSIGTNDLVQYTIAVDRANERVAYLFDPFHPAVLRLIKNVVDVGHKRGIPVTLCGEMAGDPWGCVVLLGLGVDGFSMSPMSLVEVKNTIRSITLERARALADEVLALRTQDEIHAHLKEVLGDRNDNNNSS